METLHPGVYAREQAQVPTIVGVTTSTGGFVGVTSRGRTDQAVFITSFTDFQKQFGGFLVNSYVPDSVKAFFDNGGVRAYIARVVGTGAVKATKTLDAIEDLTTDALSAESLGEGSYGNDLALQALKVATTLSTALTPGSANSCVVTSTRNLELGDVLVITDGTTTIRPIIQAINFTTRVVTWDKAITLGAGLDIGTPVYTASQHRARTKLSADLATGATSASLVDASQIVPGSILTIADGTTSTTVIVLTKNGNTVTFSAVTLGASIVAASSVVASQEFQLRVYDGDDLSEVHDYLSMESTNESDYVETRLSGTGNESGLVTITDDAPGGTAHLRIPWAVVATALASGADGATPTDTQYIGTTLPLSGLHLLDDVTDVNMVAIPGVTTIAVQSDLIDYCEGRGDTFAVLETPYAVDTAEEAREHMQILLNKNSSYYALYYPWIVVRDPFDSTLGTNRRRNVPPSGFVMGEYAENDATYGVHKAPANTTLRGPLGLTATIGDADQDILNPIGVNCVRSFPGEGIKVFGARTGWAVKDGFHYVNVRRLVNFVKLSIKGGLRYALFQPIQPELYEGITNIIQEFLASLWKNGALYPSDDMLSSYFVKCDDANNDAADRLNGRVNVEVGINPPYPAEFIILTISLYDGNLRFTESLLAA